MFASIVEFRLNPIFKEEFIDNWSQYIAFPEIQSGLIEAELHAETPITLIAYFKWHNRREFERCFLRAKDEIRDHLLLLEKNCNNVKVLHRMDIIDPKKKHNGQKENS